MDRTPIAAADHAARNWAGRWRSIRNETSLKAPYGSVRVKIALFRISEVPLELDDQNQFRTGALRRRSGERL